MEKKVKIKIISRVYDLQNSDKIEEFIYCNPDYSEDDVSTKIEVSTTGRLVFEPGGVMIEYHEDSSEMGNTATRISFDSHCPKTVSLYRTGDVKTDLVFNEKDGRSTYLYQTGDIPFELSVVTKKVDNNITPIGGSLHLDYKIEVKGMNIERTVLDMYVRVL